jgi:hypothetical protein
MAMTAHDGYCVQQAAILRRRLDVQQVDKSEQQAAVSGVDWPEQREIVAAVPRGDGFALLGQSLDSAPLSQEFLTGRPKASSASWACAVCSTWPKIPISASSIPRC